MSLEPMIASTVARTEPSPGALVDWSAYRACRTCGVGIGEQCRARYSGIVAGRPVGNPTMLERAHAHRRRRSGR